MEGVSIQTKNGQYVTAEINIKYQIEAENAYKVYKNYRTLDNLHINLMANITQRTLEEVTTKYNVIELLGEKKNEVVIEAENLLKERLKSEGVNFVMLTLKDIDAGEEIENAIKNGAVVKQETEIAEQNKIKAEKIAATKIIEAEAEAKANEIKNNQLSDKILEEKFIEKWNGELPKVMGSDGNILDISSILGKNE